MTYDPVAAASLFEANIRQVYQAWTSATPVDRHQGWVFLYSSRGTFGPAARIVILGHNPCPVPLRSGGFAEIGSYHDALEGLHPFGPFVHAIRGRSNMPYGTFASNVGILLRAVARNLRCEPTALLDQTLISNFFPLASDRLGQPLDARERSKTFLIPAPALRLPAPPGAGPGVLPGLEAWASTLWRTLLTGHGGCPPVLTPAVLVVSGYYWRRNLLPTLGVTLAPGEIQTSVERAGRRMHVFAFPHGSRAEWNVEALTYARRIAALL